MPAVLPPIPICNVPSALSSYWAPTAAVVVMATSILMRPGE